MLFTLTVPAYAQPANTLIYGQTVTGRITSESFRTVYSFQGEQHEIIDVQMQRTSGTLDPMLILLDAENNLIARSDDIGSSAAARLISITLPRSGSFFLVATRFGQDRGATTGVYSLTLERVGLASDPKVEAGGAAPIRYGDNIVRELTNASYEHLYTFGALRGDIITITMQRISGDLDSMLIVADAQGNVLLISDDDPKSQGTLDAAIIDLRIERSGNYLIAATRFGRDAGTSRGGYSLTLTRLPQESLGLTPETAILLDYGVSVRGQITTENYRRYYLIEARAGDVLTIEVTRTGGNLDPILQLLTADLRSLRVNDVRERGRFSRITAFRVPRTGSYVLVVTRFNQAEGITAGNYLLKIEAKVGGE